jgi:hypothetical protein
MTLLWRSVDLVIKTPALSPNDADTNLRSNVVHF